MNLLLSCKKNREGQLINLKRTKIDACTFNNFFRLRIKNCDLKMKKYRFPDLSNLEVLFNGRRYKAFKINKYSSVDGQEKHAHFAVWDGLFDAEVAYGTITKGTFSGFLAFSHVEIEVESAADKNDFVTKISKAQLKFFRDSSS